jgi:hypothetical protein
MPIVYGGGNFNGAIATPQLKKNLIGFFVPSGH